MKCAGRGEEGEKSPANPLTRYLSRVPPGAQHPVMERVVEGEREESRKASARRSNLGEGVARPSHMTLWMSGRSRHFQPVGKQRAGKPENV